jgi:hypothetical protein
MWAVLDPFAVKYGDHSSLLPTCREMMVVEDRIEDVDEKDRLHGKMPQSLVWDTIGTRSLAELKAPNGCLNLVRVGQMWFAGRGLEVLLQCHVNLLNNSRDRMIGNWLQLILQTVRNGLSLPTIRESESPGFPGGRRSSN